MGMENLWRYPRPNVSRAFRVSEGLLTHHTASKGMTAVTTVPAETSGSKSSKAKGKKKSESAVSTSLI